MLTRFKEDMKEAVLNFSSNGESKVSNTQIHEFCLIGTFKALPQNSCTPSFTVPAIFDKLSNKCMNVIMTVKKLISRDFLSAYVPVK